VLFEDPLEDPGLADIALSRLAERLRAVRIRASQTLFDAELRVEHAADHVRDLETRLEDWRQTQDPGVRQTPDGMVRVSHGGPPLPRIVNVVIGEAIQNLRTALDYLVYGLAWLDSGTHHDQTQFPIADHESAFESQRHRLAGVSDSHVAKIRALQPFAGCGWTGSLRDRSNQDKHWALQVTVAQGSVTATNIGQPDFETELEVRLLFEDDTNIVEWLNEQITNVRRVLSGFRGDFDVPLRLEFRGRHLVLSKRGDGPT
jgi:hypothetical protein